MSQKQPQDSVYEQLDLNINNYTITDLECFFRLNYSTSPYTADDVQYKEYLIRDQLLKSGYVNKKFKSELIGFLESAKRWIIAAKCPISQTPTSIPDNFRLDPTPTLPIPTISINRNEEIIYPPVIKPLHTTTGNNYYTGSLNPIESRIKTTNVCIDTLFRKNYMITKSTDFMYFFPKILNNVVSLKLASVEFPFVWYNCSSIDKNNVMYISLYNMNGISSSLLVNFEIVLPDGNYTSFTFAQTLNNIFNDNSNNGLNFLWCEIDNITQSTVIRARNSGTETQGRFPFDDSSLNSYYSPNFYFTIDFNIQPEGATRPAYKNLGWMLGFRQTFYTVIYSNTLISYTSNFASSITYNASLKSESVFGNNKSNYLFIEVDDFQNNFPTDSIISANDPFGNYLGKNIIAQIIIPFAPNTIISNNGSDLIFKKRDYFGPVNLEKLKIRILNKFGDVLTINQSDFSMTFEITTLTTNS
jgi:hypothetical protein